MKRLAYMRLIFEKTEKRFSNGDYESENHNAKFKILNQNSLQGKPTDNANIESFNGTFRSEFLNSHYFESGKVARRIIQGWWREDNPERN